VLQVVLTLLVTRALLRLFGYGFLQRLHHSTLLHHTNPSAEIQHWAGWVQRLSPRLFTQDHCLIDAFALRWLLARRGIPVNMIMGIHPGQTSAVQMHAWLEWRGQIIIGDLPNLDQYQRLSLKG
jgi:hypothetical protein